MFPELSHASISFIWNYIKYLKIRPHAAHTTVDMHNKPVQFTKNDNGDRATFHYSVKMVCTQGDLPTPAQLYKTILGFRENMIAVGSTLRRVFR